MMVDLAVPDEPCGGLVDNVEGLGELALGNRISSDPDALRGLVQIRRGAESGAHARGPQAGFDHGAGGALAIGPRHVHEAAGGLRRGERAPKPRDPLPPELPALPTLPGAEQGPNDA